MAYFGEKAPTRSTFDERLGVRLARARVDARLTQQEAADALGVTRETVSRWETGTRRPGLPRIKNLAKTYHVSAGFFFD